MDRATLDEMRAMLDRSDGIIEAGAKGIAFLELQRGGIAQPTQEQVDARYEIAGSVYRTDARAVLRCALDYLMEETNDR